MNIYTLIEYVPQYMRESSTTQKYPFNGAVRVYVEGDNIYSSDLDKQWARVVEDGIRKNEIPEDEPVLNISDLPVEVWKTQGNDDEF